MIEEYGFGKIVVAGIRYDKDLIIYQDKVVPNWWRRNGHELAAADIEKSVEEFNPSVIIVGSGKWGMLKVLPETKTYLENLNIGLVIERTGRAWKAYNKLLQNERPLGAFHLTC